MKLIWKRFHDIHLIRCISRPIKYRLIIFVSIRLQKLNQLTFQEVTLRRELASLGEAININALEDWEARVTEFLADLKAGVDELKTVAPQIPEEQHAVFLLKKRIVDTLVERVEIDRERNLHVQIRLNLLDILRKDARNGTTAGVQNSEDEIYTRIQSGPAHLHRFAFCV